MPLSTVSKEGGQAPAGTTKVKRLCTRELIEKAAAGRGDEMSRVSDTVAKGQAVPEVMRRRLKSSDLMRVAVTASQKEVAETAAPGDVRLVSGGFTSRPHETQAISSPLTAAPSRGIGALVPAAKPSPAPRPSPLASDLQVTPGVKNANISHLVAVYNPPGANSPVDTAATAAPSQRVAAAPPSKLFPTAAGVHGQPKNAFVGGGYGVGSATIAPSPLALTSVVCQKLGCFQPGEPGLFPLAFVPVPAHETAPDHPRIRGVDHPLEASARCGVGRRERQPSGAARVVPLTRQGGWSGYVVYRVLTPNSPRRPKACVIARVGCVL